MNVVKMTTISSDAVYHECFPEAKIVIRNECPYEVTLYLDQRLVEHSDGCTVLGVDEISIEAVVPHHWLVRAAAWASEKLTMRRRAPAAERSP